MAINDIYVLVFIIVFNVITYSYTTIYYHIMYITIITIDITPKGMLQNVHIIIYHTVLQPSKWFSGSK